MTAAATVTRLEDLAGEAAALFAAARCAGAEIRAIAPAARCAVALGAPRALLTRDAEPAPDETWYLDACGSLRASVRAEHGRLLLMADQANRAAEEAGDEGRRAAAAQYRAAARILMAAAGQCQLADRVLATAPARLAESYELVQQFAAGGGVLPRDGRWISTTDVTPGA